MITIDASETFTFPRPYIAGFAIFAEDVTSGAEGLSFIINNEIRRFRVTLNVAGYIYPARSRSYRLKEVFTGGYIVDEATGEPAALAVNVAVHVSPLDGKFRIWVQHDVFVEPPTLVDLPPMPPGYWLP